MKLSDELKALIMCYWRFTRQHYLVAIEFNYGDADVISVSRKERVVCETEVKISLEDLKKESKKPKHFKDAFGARRFNGKYIDFFYLAMPSKLTELDKVWLICDGLYPYAGILAVEPYEEYLADARNIYTNPPVRVVKEPTRVKQYDMTEETLMEIAKGMSNSFCNLAFRLMRAERGLANANL